MKNLFLSIFSLLLLFSCKDAKKQVQNPESPAQKTQNDITIKYARGFTIQATAGGHTLTIKNPWPDSKETYVYHIMQNSVDKPMHITNGLATIKAPIAKIICTSTTHIPPLVLLDQVHTLKGFPGTDYISNAQVRKLIDGGKIIELGKNQQLSVERVLTMQPDVVMGYGIDNSNPVYDELSKAGLPVVYNSDWMESHPLGKAEWIKVFGLLYDKQEEAAQIFKEIEESYLQTLKLAAQLPPTTVMTGSTWNDIWYLPYGNSWQGVLLKDAGGDYTYKNTIGKGSLAYNIERVLQDAQKAKVWIAPGQYTRYTAMKKDQPAYALFDSFKNKKVYTFAGNTGAKGGVIYYEEASMRPDLVLKDLVSILHPEAKLNHQLYFFKPLKD